MYDSILVPTDGSDVARAAAETAVELARRFDARLHVVHVLDPGESATAADDADDGLTRSAERATSPAADRATDAGLEVTVAAVDPEGSIHRAILDYAAEHAVDCIVMGTYGRTGLDRFVLGSVAERTIRESPVPVVTVHEGTTVDLPFDAILVPTDGSDCARAAADHAIELARLTGAALHTVHVVDAGVLHGGADPATLLDSLEAAGQRVLDAVVERATEAGVETVEASVLNGTPHRAIAGYADEYDVDCVVMGTHGQSGLDQRFLGSVTERVVRSTDVPVLTISDRGTEE
jgi:nucleotide-binding universal stress UspA family protein